MPSANCVLFLYVLLVMVGVVHEPFESYGCWGMLSCRSTFVAAKWKNGRLCLDSVCSVQCALDELGFGRRHVNVL